MRNLTPEQIKERYKQNFRLELKFMEENMGKVSESLGGKFTDEELDIELCSESFEIDETWIEDFEDNNNDD